MAIFNGGVKLKDVTTAELATEAIEAGKILIDTDNGSMYLDKVSGTTRIPIGKDALDTALSTTSHNAIENQALTNSIINTTAEVSAITADNIPCGTKPVKELITNLNNGNLEFQIVSGKLQFRYDDGL